LTAVDVPSCLQLVVEVPQNLLVHRLGSHLFLCNVAVYSFIQVRFTIQNNKALNKYVCRCPEHAREKRRSVCTYTHRQHKHVIENRTVWYPFRSCPDVSSTFNIWFRMLFHNATVLVLLLVITVLFFIAKTKHGDLVQQSGELESTASKEKAMITMQFCCTVVVLWMCWIIWILWPIITYSVYMDQFSSQFPADLGFLCGICTHSLQPIFNVLVYTGLIFKIFPGCPGTNRRDYSPVPGL
jgi:hypothetical protein